MKKIVLFSLIALALVLAACASPFKADVSRFQSQLPAPQGQTFAVVADDPALAGGLEFSQYASGAGIQPIVGCDIAIRREDEGGIATAGKLPTIDWLTLLVQNEQGYLNLMRLVSRAHLDFKVGSLAALPLAEIDGHTDGLLAMTGSAGSALGRLLAAGQGPAATHLVERLARLFDKRLYVELQRHGEDGERRIEGSLLDLAYGKGLPIVATNDVHFPKKAMYEAHDVLLCIEQGAHIEDPNRRRLTPEHYFKSAPEMRALFADLPSAVEHSALLAERLEFSLANLGYEFPTYPTPAGCSTARWACPPRWAAGRSTSAVGWCWR